MTPEAFLCPHAQRKDKIMQRFVTLLAGAFLLLIPASAAAIPIHQHKMVVVKRPIGHDPDGLTLQAKRVEVTHVVNVAPADVDQDGIADSKDPCVGSCPAPTPAAPASPVSVAASVPSTSTVAPAPAGGCPSYMAGEASSPSAVNPSSGAAGCYQVTPGTQDAMGVACADVNATSCVGAICAAEGNAAWASSGATPCDYIRP